MSIILSCAQSRNAALSYPRSLRMGNFPVSLNVVYTSTSTPRPVSPRPRRATCFLERRLPHIFSDVPEYPDVSVQPEAPRSRNDVPQDLSCLRPPPLEYVEGPEETRDGRVTLYQRWLYWRRLGKAYSKFYQDGMQKVAANQQEKEQILSRYSLRQKPRSDNMPTVVALMGPTSHPVKGQKSTLRKLTRREYNICIRTDADVRRAWAFSFILLFFRQLTPLVVPFLPLSMIPETCRREQDQMRDLREWVEAYDIWFKHYYDHIEVLDKSSDSFNPKSFENRRHNIFSNVLRTSFLSGFAPYIPRSMSTLAWDKIYWKGLARRHAEILADTVLILREGGFNKLSTEDVVDYCIRSGSLTFLSFARDAKRGENPTTAAMRRTMVPVLERHAKKLVDCDWTRLHPRYWALQESINRSSNGMAPDSWVNLNSQVR